MCGICGILDTRDRVEAPTLDRFTDALAHRGPDGRGTYIDDGIGLGHRRLAILDLSEAGKNPMAYAAPDGRRIWITFNGEVYNFLELRIDLEKLGHRFRTQSDTEVVVAAYAEWGSDCFRRFNGMWALAIWDPAVKRLLLSRDRFGIKPLYYLSTGARFAFASELKAFLALDGFAPALNDSAVRGFLADPTGFEGKSPETALLHVRKIPPGSWMLVHGDGRAQIVKWWETSDHIPSVPPVRERQVEQMRELVLDAVRVRMRSDVPVATCLSGGVDSSAIASAMAWVRRASPASLERCAGDWQRAFIATFPGTLVDERRFADEVVRHVSARPQYIEFDRDAMVSQFMDVVWALDDFTGAPAIPVWSTYKAMREQNVVVTLDGHGGDELLGGYAHYLDAPLDQLNRLLYAEFHATHMPYVLRNYDRCSMAHGVEVRMPLMDYRVVTFAFGLEPDMKIGRGYTKRILREAMNGIMPELNRTRRAKIGFASPLIEWLNRGLVPTVKMLTSHPLWSESPYWNGKALRQEILAKTDARAWTMDDWGMAVETWTLMSVVAWQMLFVERAGFSSKEAACQG